MRNKWNLEKARCEFIKRGYTPLFTVYKNANEKLLCLNNEGYKVTIALSKLLMDRVPQPFSNLNVYTIENIKLWLERNNVPMILLSNEFTEAKDKLLWKCKSEYEHVFETTWDCVKRGNTCGYCSGKKSYPIEIFKEKLKIVNPSLKVLSKEYKSGLSDITCECLVDGNIFTSKARYLLKGNGCKVCTDTIVYDIGSFKEKVYEINPYVDIKEDVYINNRTPMKFYCKKHNKIWYSTPVSLLKGRGCDDCHSDKVSGENNYAWKGGITSLKQHFRGQLLKWKKDTMIECNYKCDVSNERFDDIHHLYSFDLILTEFIDVFDLDQKTNIGEYNPEYLDYISKEFLEFHNKYGLGVCMKKEYHKEFHEIYGYGNNTPEQYIEFKNNKIKIEKAS